MLDHTVCSQGLNGSYHFLVFIVDARGLAVFVNVSEKQLLELVELSQSNDAGLVHDPPGDVETGRVGFLYRSPESMSAKPHSHMCVTV